MSLGMPHSKRNLRNLRGYEVCQRSALRTLRLQLQNGWERSHHKTCWKAKTSRWAYGRCS